MRVNISSLSKSAVFEVILNSLFGKNAEVHILCETLLPL